MTISAPPSGTVTFLFTDIEGSTKLAREHPEAWEMMQTRHHTILREAMERHHGYIFQIIGDAFCAAFHTAGDALRAAIKSQTDLQAENRGGVPLKVRMGIHTGKAGLQADGQYRGYLAMSRVQRLMSAGHGGQVLISAASQELLLEDLPEDVSLRDLGERRLKDLIRPEHVYQLIVPGLPVEFPPLKTLDFYRHNLPVQLTSFIGREREMAEIQQALLTHRLVTLTGAGGTGKTRLALQAAANVLDHFPQGVWFVELASLANPELVPQAILSAFGMPERPGLTQQQQLLDYLREKKLLLILDNCEHLIQACAELTNALLGSSSNLRILATSREALGVQGEMIWHVPSLSLPDSKELPVVERLSQYEAVQLFIDRAILVQPHFQVTNDNAPAVAQICFRLDGIPLAIELAAARVKTLDTKEIAKRLDDRFRLLTGGSRTALERHQTLRATIDWSYNLLSAEEKTLLGRLSVFAAGWTLAAAEQVCAGNGTISADDVLDLLTHLVDKSLVILDGSRYRMLETTRQYAREKLLESEDGKALRDRHLDYFVARAEQANRAAHGPEEFVWRDILELDDDNLRAALEWSISEKRTESALRLLGTWAPTGLHGISEILHWFDRLYALPDIRAYPAFYARVLNVIVGINWIRGKFLDAKWMAEESQAIHLNLGEKGELGLAEACARLGSIVYSNNKDTKAAESLFERSLALYQKHGDAWGMGMVMFLWGHMELDEERYARAEEFLMESLSKWKQAGDPVAEPHVFNSLGILAQSQGDYERAGSYYEQVLHAARELRAGISLSVSSYNLVWVYLHRGDYRNARARLQESFEMWKDAGDLGGVMACLAGFAAILGMNGKRVQAAKLFGAYESLLEASGISHPTDQKEIDHYVALTREQLAPVEFEKAWAEGRQMTLEQAMDFALKETEV